MSPTAHVSEAGPPVGRSAMKMHDSDDIDALGLDAIQETVGKLGHQNTPEPPAERRARGKETRAGVRRCGHRSEERAFLITFSAGIPATFPDLISPKRRSAS